MFKNDQIFSPYNYGLIKLVGSLRTNIPSRYHFWPLTHTHILFNKMTYTVGYIDDTCKLWF